MAVAITRSPNTSPQELLLEAPLAVRLGERRDQVGRGAEEHPVAGLDRLEPQAHAQVLADPGWAKDHHVVAVLDEVAAGEGLVW